MAKTKGKMPEKWQKNLKKMAKLNDKKTKNG
jgi:hypothetical protein